MKNTIFNKVCAFCDFRGHNAIVLEMHVKSVHSQEIERNSSPNEKSKNIGPKSEKDGKNSRKRRNGAKDETNSSNEIKKRKLQVEEAKVVLKRDEMVEKLVRKSKNLSPKMKSAEKALDSEEFAFVKETKSPKLEKKIPVKMVTLDKFVAKNEQKATKSNQNVLSKKEPKSSIKHGFEEKLDGQETKKAKLNQNSSKNESNFSSDRSKISKLKLRPKSKIVENNQKTKIGAKNVSQTETLVSQENVSDLEKNISKSKPVPESRTNGKSKMDKIVAKNMKDDQKNPTLEKGASKSKLGPKSKKVENSKDRQNLTNDKSKMDKILTKNTKEDQRTPNFEKEVSKSKLNSKSKNVHNSEGGENFSKTEHGTSPQNSLPRVKSKVSKSKPALKSKIVTKKSDKGQNLSKTQESSLKVPKSKPSIKSKNVAKNSEDQNLSTIESQSPKRVKSKPGPKSKTVEKFAKFMDKSGISEQNSSEVESKKENSQEIRKAISIKSEPIFDNLVEKSKIDFLEFCNEPNYDLNESEQEFEDAKAVTDELEDQMSKMSQHFQSKFYNDRTQIDENCEIMKQRWANYSEEIRKSLKILQNDTQQISNCKMLVENFKLLKVRNENLIKTMISRSKRLAKLECLKVETKPVITKSNFSFETEPESDPITDGDSNKSFKNNVNKNLSFTDPPKDLFSSDEEFDSSSRISDLNLPPKLQVSNVQDIFSSDEEHFDEKSKNPEKYVEADPNDKSKNESESKPENEINCKKILSEPEENEPAFKLKTEPVEEHFDEIPDICETEIQIDPNDKSKIESDSKPELEPAESDEIQPNGKKTKIKRKPKTKSEIEPNDTQIQPGKSKLERKPRKQVLLPRNQVQLPWQLDYMVNFDPPEMITIPPEKDAKKPEENKDLTNLLEPMVKIEEGEIELQFDEKSENNADKCNAKPICKWIPGTPKIWVKCLNPSCDSKYHSECLNSALGSKAHLICSAACSKLVSENPQIPEILKKPQKVPDLSCFQKDCSSTKRQLFAVRFIPSQAITLRKCQLAKTQTSGLLEQETCIPNFPPVMALENLKFHYILHYINRGLWDNFERPKCCQVQNQAKNLENFKNLEKFKNLENLENLNFEDLQQLKKLDFNVLENLNNLEDLQKLQNDEKLLIHMLHDKEVDLIDEITTFARFDESFNKCYNELLQVQQPQNVPFTSLYESVPTQPKLPPVLPQSEPPKPPTTKLTVQNFASETVEDNFENIKIVSKVCQLSKFPIEGCHSQNPAMMPIEEVKNHYTEHYIARGLFCNLDFKKICCEISFEYEDFYWAHLALKHGLLVKLMLQDAEVNMATDIKFLATYDEDFKKSCDSILAKADGNLE